MYLTSTRVNMRTLRDTRVCARTCTCTRVYVRMRACACVSTGVHFVLSSTRITSLWVTDAPPPYGSKTPRERRGSCIGRGFQRGRSFPFLKEGKCK